MGNRAVLSIGKYKPEAVGIYLHWHGGRDSIEAFLNATKKVMHGRGEDGQYATARLIQVISNFFGGNTSIGVDKCDNLDCDNFNNGVYEIDPDKLEIIGRKFYKIKEQKRYELEKMTKDILKRMPESYQ